MAGWIHIEPQLVEVADELALLLIHLRVVIGLFIRVVDLLRLRIPFLLADLELEMDQGVEVVDIGDSNRWWPEFLDHLRVLVPLGYHPFHENSSHLEEWLLLGVRADPCLPLFFFVASGGSVGGVALVWSL